MIKTDLDVINAACALVGHTPLETLEEETPGGSAIGLVYQEIVGFNFGMHPFSFGTILKELTRLDANGEPLNTGYSYSHRLWNARRGAPLKVIRDPRNANDDFTDYLLIEDELHADEKQLWGIFKHSPPPLLWSSTFVTATTLALASRLAMIFASDTRSMQLWRTEAYGTPQERFRGGAMRVAINEDSFGTPPKKAQWSNNPLTNSWTGGRNSGDWQRGDE
ncbi:MAG: hypothetical protein JKY92_09325 [Magnetovibrio sp.]|nr:hypothetical protein [Magnetovibrio sp.]